MHRGLTGRYEATSAGGEQVRAFVPSSLPPVPPLELSHARQRLLERATLALGRLDSVTLLLPEPDLFLIRVLSAGSRALLANRRPPVVARPTAAVRAGRGPGRPAGRPGRSPQLRGRAQPRAGPTARRIPAVEPPDPRDALPPADV